jgi:hypothetical protein
VSRNHRPLPEKPEGHWVPCNPEELLFSSREKFLSVWAGGAEKKLPLAQEPLPGPVLLVVSVARETGLTDALRSPLIHNFSSLEHPSALILRLI